MNLQEILIGTCGGFLAGLGVGLTGIPEKFEERLEIIEMAPEEKRKTSNEGINYLKNKLKMVKYVVPIIMGGTYSLLASGGPQNSSSFVGNSAITIPSVYLGRFVGAKIRKIKTRDRFNDQKLMAQVSLDPKNIDKYLLSKEERENVEKSFSEIEKKIIEGNEKDVFPNLREGPLKDMYDLFIGKGPKYTPYLLTWSLKKHGEIMGKAVFQKNITDFYEAPYQEKLGPGEIIDCTIVGVPQNIKLKVFIKEQNDFYVQTFNWPNLKIIADDKARESIAENIKPETSISDREIWTGDYKSLANFITKEREGYSIMLMKAPLELSSEVKEKAITAIFLQNYESYHRNKKS